MEKEVVKHHQHPHNNTNNNNSTTRSHRERHTIGEGFIRPPQSADFVLRWGNRKRPRCMKIQVKNESTPIARTTVRVDRRVVRSDNSNTNNNNNTNGSGNHPSNGHFNLRQRPASVAQPPPRFLRGFALQR